MGNLHGLLQFLARASGVVSGRMADILSPARMVIIGTAMTAMAKPMFGACGIVHAALGVTACWYWIAGLKVGTAYVLHVYCLLVLGCWAQGGYLLDTGYCKDCVYWY
jgi:hypothetical protein